MFNPLTDQFDPLREGFTAQTKGNPRVKVHGDGPHKWRVYIGRDLGVDPALRMQIWKPRNELLYDGAPRSHDDTLRMLQENGWKSQTENPFSVHT